MIGVKVKDLEFAQCCNSANKSKCLPALSDAVFLKTVNEYVFSKILEAKAKPIVRIRKQLEYFLVQGAYFS